MRVRCEIQLRSRDRQKVSPFNATIELLNLSMHVAKYAKATFYDTFYDGIVDTYLATPTARLLCSRPFFLARPDRAVMKKAG